MSHDLDPVIIDGVRTPFMRSHNAFVSLSACDLGRLALRGVVNKTGIDPNLIEHLTMGTVIHDPRTSNIARESLLAAGLPAQIPCNTVTLACISSNVAATQLADMIRLGRIGMAVFSGVDTCSDPPIRLSEKLRKTLVKLEKVKGPGDFLKHMHVFKGLSFRDLLPDVPKVVEFSNGKSMGQGCELLAQQAGATRAEADAYAVRSHKLAAEAQAKGIFAEHVIPVYPAPKFQAITQDDGPRGDSNIEKLAKIRPAFDKQFGICTAGNSSFLTDGSSAVLVASRAKAKELGLTPKAVIRDYVYRAADALYDMLSGPALTIPKLLAKNNLKAQDVGVWEIHEAFAAQMVANMKLMLEQGYEIPLEQINIWGGSLSLGHPFGATGGRLLYTAAKRLQESGERYAVVSGCAAGGHGSAILLERV